MRPFLLFLGVFFLTLSCSGDKKSGQKDEEQPEVLVKKRDDGSISSVNPVDAMGMVHGVRLTYYNDGKSYYSKISYVRQENKHGFASIPFFIQPVTPPREIIKKSGQKYPLSLAISW